MFSFSRLASGNIIYWSFAHASGEGKPIAEVNAAQADQSYQQDGQREKMQLTALVAGCAPTEPPKVRYTTSDIARELGLLTLCAEPDRGGADCRSYSGVLLTHNSEW